MPKPVELCLEDLTAEPGSPEYLQCVAKAGGELGLSVDASARVRWEQASATAAFELWVSQDERLILERRDGAPGVVVRRAGRSLEAPAGKPVVLCDQDEVEMGERRWRVHVHGVAAQVYAPKPLFRKVLAPLAAAAALAAAACSPAQSATPPRPDAGAVAATPDAGVRPIEVRDMPPKPAAKDYGERGPVPKAVPAPVEASPDKPTK